MYEVTQHFHTLCRQVGHSGGTLETALDAADEMLKAIRELDDMEESDWEITHESTGWTLDEACLGLAEWLAGSKPERLPEGFQPVVKSLNESDADLSLPAKSNQFWEHLDILSLDEVEP